MDERIFIKKDIKSRIYNSTVIHNVQKKKRVIHNAYYYLPSIKW